MEDRATVKPVARPAEGEAEIERAFELRRRVFCDEQGVSMEAEFDGLDEQATHIVALVGEELVGTCRLLYEGEVCRLGRMAVAREARRSGGGSALVEASLKAAREAGCERIVIHAQRQAEDFYAGCGFDPYGETFLEEGIPHVMMRRAVMPPPGQAGAAAAGGER